MSFRTGLLKTLDGIRGMLGTTGLDLRTSQLTIRTRTYTGGRRSSEAAYTDSDIVLPQRYKVRQLQQQDVVESGGRYEDGDIIVGPVTPSDGSGTGYTTSQLAPHPSSNGTEIIYILSGAVAGEYTLKTLNSDRPFRYELVLSRRRTTP